MAKVVATSHTSESTIVSSIRHVIKGVADTKSCHIVWDFMAFFNYQLHDFSYRFDCSEIDDPSTTVEQLACTCTLRRGWLWDLAADNFSNSI
jgi:hypothetical protein